IAVTPHERTNHAGHVYRAGCRIAGPVFWGEIGRFCRSRPRGCAYTMPMIALAKDIDRDDGPHEDHFVHLRGATWEDYERLLEVRGEHSVPRITYFEGTIEVMGPSHTHEALKSTIGRLVEVWCLERGIVFSTLGSWTLKSKTKKSGLEPDECYVFGQGRDAARPDLAAAGNAPRPEVEIDRASKATRPDLAIEV